MTAETLNDKLDVNGTSFQAASTAAGYGGKSHEVPDAHLALEESVGCSEPQGCFSLARSIASPRASLTCWALHMSCAPSEEITRSQIASSLCHVCMHMEACGGTGPSSIALAVSRARRPCVRPQPILKGTRIGSGNIPAFQELHTETAVSLVHDFSWYGL